MREEEIKRKRTESRLVELIPEALSTMNDNRINGLTVTEVVCSRGRYDAKVYLDKSYLDTKEQNEALKQLRKVASYIQNHCKQSEGWFKAPRLTFEFDDHFVIKPTINFSFEADYSQNMLGEKGKERNRV